MAKKHSNKFVWFVVIGVVAAAAGLGYYTNSLQLREVDTANVNANAAEATSEQAPATAFDASALTVRADDIVLGNANAPHTIVEYSSLSCPHCAHFHKEILPEVKKKLIDTGKVRHVVRYFPLNLPALSAAELVECGPKSKRLALLETLYARQDDWAFVPTFRNELKAIAKEHGIDAAAFDSCMEDEALEARILGNRKEGMEKLHVKGTPSFFLDGKPLLLNGLTTDAFIDAVEASENAE